MKIRSKIILDNNFFYIFIGFFPIAAANRSRMIHIVIKTVHYKGPKHNPQPRYYIKEWPIKPQHCGHTKIMTVIASYIQEILCHQTRTLTTNSKKILRKKLEKFHKNGGPAIPPSHIKYDNLPLGSNRACFDNKSTTLLNSM